MKKYILTLVAIFATFILSACGGGGGGSTGTSAVASKAVDLVNAGPIIFVNAVTNKSFSIQVTYQKNLNDNYVVKVYTESIDIPGCTVVPGSVKFNPYPVVMTQNTGSKAVMYVTGQVDAACVNTTDYILNGRVTVEKDGSIAEEILNVSSVAASNPTTPTNPGTPGTGAQYTLAGATTPVIVNNDNEIKNISVNVVDANGIGVPDQNVSIQAITDPRFGAITSASTVQTDSSGKALFTYKAPANVQAVDGNTTTVDLIMVSNGTEQRQTVTITFNKTTQNVVAPIVVISNQYRDINLTSNSQSVTMEVRVFEEGSNAPYTQGNVNVRLPLEVLNGVDVGTFSAYSVPVGTNGIATFNYTGPRDLAALINSGYSSAVFQFNHESNSNQSGSVTVHYVATGSYQPAQYIVNVSSSDGNNTMNLASQKSFVIELKDDQGNLIDNSNITELNITTRNVQIGTLVDGTTGSTNQRLTYNGTNAVNSKSFHVKTNTLSGIVPIEVSITFVDANGNTQTLSKVINIVVFSGPPTAMSLSYVGVEHNATIGKFIEKFAVTVTDAYNNPVNTRPYISTGAMVEYAVDGNASDANRTTTSPRLWHGRNDSNATLVSNGQGAQPSLSAVDANVFRYVDLNNDKVVLFGAGYVYEALGKWDIENRVSGQELLLTDNYFGSTRSGLYYAVGHNNRQDLCSPDGREYVGNMKASQYQLDETGHAYMEFEYDYHLTGKDVMIWVNLLGFQADNNQTGRIGEVQKHTLRGTGFVSYDSYVLPAGAQNVAVTFYIHHKDVPEWYRNGHFGAAFEPTACKVTGIVDSSNLHDARDCNNQVGYLTVTVSNPSTSDCTIKLQDSSIAVAPEFNSGLQTTFP